jgi:hypothetical protein
MITHLSRSIFAGPAVFLLSPAAGYTIGGDLLVGGGFLIW